MSLSQKERFAVYAYLRRFLLNRWVTATLLCGCALLTSAWLPSQSQMPASAIVVREIHYRNVEASVAALVWGINDWQMLPPELQPPGTTVLQAPTRSLMQTPMNWQNGEFVVQIQVPAGATIHFIVHILKSRTGVSVDAWDENLAARQFIDQAQYDGIAVFEASSGLAEQTYTTTADSHAQSIVALVLLAISFVLAMVVIRTNIKNPYLDF